MEAYPVNVAPRPKTQVEVFVDEILPENSSVLLRLPAGVSPERFKNSLQIAVMMQPKLLRCEPRIVFREVSRVANYGLSLDPSMGEAWLILRKNKQGHDEPQAQLGFRGKMKLARQSGEVARLVAYPVTEKMLAEGRFKVTLQTLVYEPDPFNDDTAPVGFFAYILYKDGTEDFETMSIREIYKIRDRSDGYRAFKKGAIKSTPWADYEGEMCKKTVLSRLLKRVPMSADVVELMREDDGADFTEVAEEDITPAKLRQTKADALRAIAAQSDEPPAPKRGPGRPRKEASATSSAFAGSVDEPEPATDLQDDGNESETEGEQETAESADVGQEPTDVELDEPTEPQGVDRRSKDYQRGADDFAAGLKRCLNAEIRADVQRFENWKAGWLEAKEEADEAENGREDA
jgi:recombination protein RecT